MAASIADLRARVSIDGADKAKSDLKDLKGAGGASGGGIMGLADSFKTGLGAVSGFLAGFGAVTVATDALGFLKDQMLDVIQAGMNQQQIMAQTAAVIKSTGGAAGFSSEQIGAMSDSLAQLTGISNDTIQSSANVLLTFRDIGHNIFPQAEKAILDVSVAMHEDLQSATVQVGKALNDPITGMTALQRIGVTFTQSQKDVIKQMVKTGDSAGAQKLIIGELTKEFGNSATAAGTTLPGKLAILNEKFDEAKEKVAGAVIPVLSDLVSKYVMPLADDLGRVLPGAITVLTNFLTTQLEPAIQTLLSSPLVQTIEGWATSIADKLAPQLNVNLPNAAKNSTSALQNTNDHLKALADTAAGPYVAKSQKAIDKIDQMTNSLGGTTPTGKGLNPAIMRVNSNLDNMDAKLNASAAAAKAAQKPPEFLGGIFDSLGHHIQDAGDHIGGFFSGIAERFGPALPNIKKILASVSDDFSLFGDGIHNILDGLGAFLSAPFRMGFDLLEGVFNVGLDLIKGDIGKAGDDAKMALHNIWNDVQDWGAGLGRILIGIGESVIGWIIAPFKASWKQAETNLNNFKDDMSKWWSKTLQPAVEQAVADVMQHLQDFINSHMPHFPGINFPAFPGQARASGGPVSGSFLGAERSPELLVTPGIYTAPPGSYVYNNQQTRAMLGGNGGGRSGGNSYTITVNAPVGNEIASQIDRHIQRRELLLRMRG